MIKIFFKLRFEFSRESQISNSPPFLAIDEISILETFGNEIINNDLFFKDV